MSSIWRILQAMICLLWLMASTGRLHGDPPRAEAELVKTIAGAVESTGPFQGPAVVFLCDAMTGMPVWAKSEVPLNGLEAFRHEVSDDQGSFRFKDVPPGKYRLVAETWEGIRGLPKFPDGTPETVTIRGICEDVLVSSAGTTGDIVNVRLTPLGTRSVELLPDPAEGSAFVVLSKKQPIGGETFAGISWGREFLTNALLITHLSHPKLKVHGLPEKTEVTMSAFYYDNLPGMGGATWNTSQQAIVQFKIYAGWSNGHRLGDPPPELKDLTEYCLTHAAEVKAALLPFDQKFLETIRKSSPQQAWDELGGPDRVVALPDFGQTSLLALIQARSYARQKK